MKTPAKWVLAMGCSWGLCSAAAAANPIAASADLAEMSLEDLMSIPVFAASKQEQKMEDAPAYVTLITADDIRTYGYRTLADALESVPGCYVSDDRNYSYVGVRGFARPGDYNTRVLVLINGARANEPVYDSTGAGLDFNIDIDSIERIEVIRGPGSALYGTSAFFGVINIITKTGASDPGVNLSATAGSYDAYSGRFSVGGIASNGVQAYISGQAYVEGGQSFYFREYDVDGVSDGVSRSQFDEETAENAFMHIRYQDLVFQTGYVRREKDVPTGAYGTIFNMEDAIMTMDDRFLSDVVLTLEPVEDWSVMARAGYSLYSYDGHYILDYSEAGDGSQPTPNIDDTRAEWYTSELKVTTDAIDNHRLTVGSEYRLNTELFQKNYDVEPYTVYTESKEDMAVLSAYAQDELSITRRLALVGGVRWDHYEIYDSAFSPRLAAILKPVDGTTVKLLYGEAFRAPNAYETYYADSTMQQRNESIEPEDITTYEAVVEQRVNTSLQLVGSVFHYDMHNLIGQHVDEDTGFIFFDNLAPIEADGGEVEAIYRAPAGLEGRISYAYVDASDAATGEPLSNSAEHVAKMKASAPVVYRPLRAAMELQYLGDRMTVSGGTVEDYFVVNLSLLAVNLLDRWEASATLYNALDERYYDPVGEELLQDRLEQDGRSFRVKLACRF